MPYQKIKIEAEVTLTGLVDFSDFDDLADAAEVIADEIGGAIEQTIENRCDDDCTRKDLSVSSWVIDEGSVFDR
jgi:hypothetical protein